ncbi:mannan endo-1,4-beta-mannosidase 6-like [Olea europaea subsp. europaea]|uniref:Mannan endo-1,4-beta-mannosidase 6-like n=1 Tax=Olea europaea subsp. europaea TaxID=158383 RepID=A0A8S0QC18_OLEEU|nr:mannan endo-1,4-beta-mannosidase 6-like [Olea europaea subsp. europaea]
MDIRLLPSLLRFMLVDNGNIESPVLLNGWNSYWLMEESVRGASKYGVSDMLKKGAEMGMTVCKTWAFRDGARPNDLQWWWW